MDINQISVFYQKKLSKFVEHVLSLLVVFLLLSAATLWTGRYLGHEIGTTNQSAIQQSQALTQPTTEQLQQLGIEAGKFTLTERDSASWNVLGANGTEQGVLIASAPYAQGVKGFAGPTPLYIYVDAGGRVREIVAADNADTPHFFQEAFEGLVPYWLGKNLSDAASLKVDAVSGATFSSKAIIANVQQSLAAQAGALDGTILPTPTIGWGRTVCVILVLLTGIVISFKFRGNKVLRIIQLVLNVVVLGFWCGQFLSLSLLRGWLSNGLDPIAYLPTLLVLATAVLMPFFKRKHHYCSWVCPLGSAQELASRLPFPKIHCSPKVYKAMSRVRMIVFSLLMLLLWTAFWAGKILDYEPFTAFFYQSALPAVIALAIIIVVASCFIPNVWCKACCPMGQTLDLAEDCVVKSNK